MSKTRKAARSRHVDWVFYILKVLMYLLIGCVWLKFDGYLVFPIGAAVGALLAQKDHFVIDRKIEYAVLVVSALLGLLGWGLYLVI